MTKHVIIVGSGPAGLTAAIYCATAGFKTTVITGKDFGGNIAKTNSIINWPSIEEISGADLVDNMVAQCEKLGVNFVFDIMTSFTNDKVFLESRNPINFDGLILALGTKPKILEELSGKDNVHYCATCDGFLYKNKNVLVIGSGDSAFTQAIYLSNICKSVTISTKENIKAQQYLVDKAKQIENISIVLNKKLSDATEDGIFVAIGSVDPCIEDYNDTEDPPENIWIAGDITKEHKHRQAVIAAADGAEAAINVIEYLLTWK